MDRVSLDDAAGRLAFLVERVERGEEVEITRDGRPVAKLSAPKGIESHPTDVVARARALRDQISAGGESFSWEELKQMRDEDRP